MAVEFGGKTIYGASVGILMLETRFPRIHGDMANAFTWPFPVQYRIVRGASPDRVIRHRSKGLEQSFANAARDLVAHGVDGITSNCGFLSLLQNAIQDAVDVPVATSALVQVPWINSLMPGDRRAGILTISGEDLSGDHLKAVGVPANTPVEGTEKDGEFACKIIGDLPEIDFAKCRADVLDAAGRLVRNHSEVGAIVLECTNMVPYAAKIRKVTGLPVYSIYSFILWFQSGLLPRRFTQGVDDPRPDRSAAHS